MSPRVGGCAARPSLVCSRAIARVCADGLANGTHAVERVIAARLSIFVLPSDTPHVLDAAGLWLQASLGTACTPERERGGGMPRVLATAEGRFRRPVVPAIASLNVASDIEGEPFYSKRGVSGSLRTHIEHPRRSTRETAARRVT